MPRVAFKLFFSSLFFGLLFFSFSKISFAETTPYRSAATVTSAGGPAYTNLENCSATDGLTCDRASSSSYGDLDFRDFGDFGIPEGATITHIRIRVTGKTQTPSLAVFAAVSRVGPGPLPFYESCQHPDDFWRMYVLNSPTITVYNVTTPLTNGYLDECLTATNIETNNFIFRLHYSNALAWTANIDNFEIAFDYTPAAPTPTPSPSPTPTPPPPFLDLPWDYEGKGLSFNEAALNINSFFDHEFPLLSTGLSEPGLIVKFNNPQRIDDSYSSHDGYDYGTPAKVEFGDPVLAAAAGTATFVNACGACGNAIHIDHGNGYQTRYYHLQSDGLITNIPSQDVTVNAGEQIGKVGATGNVRPEGETGAHIHFMVIQDKNDDGNFDDNMPDGLVDPFGWQSDDPDPWENYEFFYNGEDRIGNKSYYLWNNQIDGLDANLTANGGVFSSGRNSVTFPEGATNQNLLLKIISAPIQKLSDLISSIGSSVQITAEDSSGNQATNFNQPFSVSIGFSDFDLTRYLTDTLSIYSSSDGIDWIKEDTQVDWQNQNATAEIDHLSYFALMAERKDTQAATTAAVFTGDEGDPGWFRSDVSVSLEAVDNEGGLGVDYVLYKLGPGDWQGYSTPLEFTDEGEHAIEFYSVDNDENIEEPKTATFTINKSIPEAEIDYSLQTKNIEFYGKDGEEETNVAKTNEGWNKKIVISDKAGNTLTILANIFTSKSISWISFLSLQYNDAAPVVLDKNYLFVIPTYNRKTGALTSLTEVYSVKNKNIIGIFYSASTNKTKIYNYDRKNKQLLKEELAGMRLLKLFTETGTLNYSY